MNGSSPRLRGTRADSAFISQPHRFIPAPAGNALAARLQANPLRIHPRACGERRYGTGMIWSCTGSSPRLRGTHAGQPPRIVLNRFIPAPAGNAFYPRCFAIARPVHPRACGERLRRRIMPNALHGSSPRLRGTRDLGVVQPVSRRFIPAPAGNARACRGWWPVASVHPRACGERSQSRWPFGQGIGSSPRLRGTRAEIGANGQRHRFIPAPAGNA